MPSCWESVASYNSPCQPAEVGRPCELSGGAMAVVAADVVDRVVAEEVEEEGNAIAAAEEQEEDVG
jgi:hypothetical protein